MHDLWKTNWGAYADSEHLLLKYPKCVLCLSGRIQFRSKVRLPIRRQKDIQLVGTGGKGTEDNAILGG